MSRFDNIHEYDNSLAGAGLRIGIVMSRFNLPVCEGLLSSSVAELKRLGVGAGDKAHATRPRPRASRLSAIPPPISSAARSIFPQMPSGMLARRRMLVPLA